jgi:hypothetical protein
MLLAVITALLLAVFMRSKPARRAPIYDPTGPVLSIEPPESARHQDPDDLDPPVPE